MPASSRLNGLAAVIFDFDGVLANSEPLHLRVFQQVLATVGVTLSDEEYYAGYLGYSDQDALRVLARDRGLAFDEATIERLATAKTRRFRDVARDESVLFPNSAACVEQIAAAVPVAIASGALRDEIELMLEPTGLRKLFSVIVAADDTPRSKPAPDPYERAFTLLQNTGRLEPTARPAHVVAIEDSPWGIQSARDAGLRTIGVTTSYDADRLSEAELVLPSLSAVTLPILASVVAAASDARTAL
ncbi:MAG: HAD-IA family hydrolase [Luteitalea sp.]|nr:HAD-IA family hydrolase [Luteitalea sp.]